VYAWAAYRATGAEGVRARLVYLGFDPIRVDDVETEPARVSALVEAMSRAFESGRFEATPGKICATCEHRSHCAFAVSG